MYVPLLHVELLQAQLLTELQSSGMPDGLDSMHGDIVWLRAQSR